MTLRYASSTDSSDPHNLAYHSQLERVRPVIEMASKSWKDLSQTSTSSATLAATSQSVIRINNSSSSNSVNATTFAPFDEDEVKDEDAIDREWRVEVLAADTQCSSTYGPLKAFDFHCSAGSVHRAPFEQIHPIQQQQQPGN